MLSRKEKLEKIYFTIIEWGTYLALFTPFIFIRDYFFPFVAPKTIFFRIVVDIIFIAYILLVISNPRYRPKLTPLTITITAFLGILILTSLTGINFEKSFWSVFERMAGLLTFFHLYAFYIILSSVFKERKYWERILSVSISVGILICLYTLTSEEAASRGGGTLGNTSFLSAYLLFDIFFAIILFLAKTGGWRIFSGPALIIMIATLFFNPEPTRGAIGAFLGGIFVFILGYMIFSGKKILKRLAPVVLISVVLIGIGLSQTNFFKEKIIDIKDVPGRGREIVWQMGFKSWQEKFWLGWGPENFNIPFAKYFDPELPLTVDIWYDRVHSIILDTGVNSGIVGLLSYLAIFGMAIWGLVRICPKVVERKNIFFPLGMISLLLVYFAQNVWVFDMVSSYMIFFLTLAFINFLVEGGKPEAIPPKKIKTGGIYLFSGVLLIIITILAFYFGNIQVARASKFTVKGIALPAESSIAAFQKAMAVSPISKFEVPEQIATKFSGLIFQSDQNKDVLAKGLILAEEELKNSINQDSRNFRLYLFLGRFYNNLYQFTNNEEKLNLAEETLKKAAELSPKNQQVYWSLAQTKLSQGKQDEAIEFLQKAVTLEPRFGQSHWYLATIYRIVGKYELALSEANEAEKFGYNWKGNINDLKQIAEVYRALGDTTNLVSLYELGIKIAPEDGQLWANLADVYATLGEREKAKNAAEKVLKLKPELKPQIEQFLKELGY